MATTPLVEHDLERGAALIGALNRAHVPVEFVAWSYSDDDEDWRLIIATPLVESHGRVATYERIREVLADDPWLDPGVGRVVLISPEEPDIRRLRELAQSPITDDLAMPGERGVIRGRPIDASYVYNTAALRFEDELFAAIQRLAPTQAIIRRAGKVFDSPHQVDFVLDSGHHMVVVEVKARDRPVTSREVQSLRLGLPLEAALIVVSRAGFANGTLAKPPDLYLVTWRSPADDPQLGAALKALLA